MSKRAFPYYSELEDLEIKRPAIAGGANPGQEPADPRLFDGGQSFEVRAAAFAFAAADTCRDAACYRCLVSIMMHLSSSGAL